MIIKKFHWEGKSVPRSSEINGKYIFSIICIILVFFTVISSSVQAENVEDTANKSIDNSTGNFELNESSYQAQILSESNLSTKSDIIPTLAYLTSNFTGTESILSTVTHGTDQDVSAIWEDYVVWRSTYKDLTNPESYLSDIFLYNISTGECIRIGSNLSALTIPDIWNDLIVWATGEDGSFEIFLYNISTSETTRITNDSVNQVKPRIWGDHIVWQQGLDIDPETAVYLYTIGTGLTLQLDAGSGYAQSPAIWEDRIVWQDGRNGNDFDIYLYNCTSGIETQITVDPAMQTNPSIWRDSVVWEDLRESYYHIYLYDLISGNETQVTFGEDDQVSPKIFENFVVYVNQSGIYLTDFLSMNAGQISDGDRDSVQLNPSIWNNRITWTDNRYGDYDIFLLTIGVERSPLLVDFTQNITQGEAPLTVGFTDTSSGQIDGWHWDFGDNNSSEEQNPVHMFATPGSYSVTLNVHNQWQRNGTQKQDLISVGSVPLPQFSVNQTSGPAPLIIQFTDESSGNPTEWNWEFGDGQLSADPKPSHTYEQPGVYDINLTISNIYGNATLVKHKLISVMDGTYQTCILPTQGIQINNTDSGPVLELNTVLTGNCTFDQDINPDLILCIPEDESGIAQISFFSQEETEFSYSDNETITGLLGQVTMSSCDLVPMNFSQNIGNNCRFNFTVSLPIYPEEGILQVVAWEDSTPEDLNTFNHISSDYNYVRVEDLAYTVRFTEENIPDNESATLIFGVSPAWVELYGWRWCHSLESDPSGAAVYVDGSFVGLTPLCAGDGLSPGNHTVVLKKSGYTDYITHIILDDKRDSIHVIRIGDDGSGEVLNTTFIGHDQVRNLDFFRAESPNGLSTFGLASLSKSGNIFQIAQMTAAAVIRPSSGGGGGGSSSGSHWVSENAAAQATTSVPTLAPTSAGTPVTISESPRDTGPESSVSPGITIEPKEATPQPTGDTSFWGSLATGTSALIILKNLSIVFVVIFVTIVFYFRWKKKEE
jgi:beta propeller repeat protein